MRIGLVVHAAHRLIADAFKLQTQTHTLAVGADAGGEVAAAAVITAAIQRPTRKRGKKMHTGRKKDAHYNSWWGITNQQNKTFEAGLKVDVISLSLVSFGNRLIPPSGMGNCAKHSKQKH